MAKAARKITSAKRPTSKRAPRAQKKNRAAAPVAVAESTPFSLPDEDIEALLQSGERNGALEDYFGPEQYEELRGLAQQAATRSVRGGERVFILPGIMGSRIGRKGDVIWVDPIDIARGKLSELKLPPPKQPVQAVGVILLAYLTLKLRLRIAGFDADFFPFDWRQTIPDLGKALAKRITEERDAKKGKPLYVVAHSMGGLVTRASLPHLKDDQRPNRIILLGTPHLGSFSPVQAFRGVHSTVNKVAALDFKHDPQDLAEIFATFPGLLEMIPAQSISKIDLFDLASWPNAGKRPDAAMLRSAKKVLTDLPTGPGEIIIVAGVNRDTVVEAKLEGDEFVYTIIKDGDGTVPLASARLSTASKIYFIEEDHGALAGNRQIQSALPSLLTTGKTSELSETFESSRAQVVRRVSDRQLATEVRTRGVPSTREQRVMIEEFAAPPSAAPSVLSARPAEAMSLVPEPGAERFSGRVTVGRSQQQRLDITLARGSITEADAACYVVGVFQNVAPGGAAAAIDTMMGGAINDRVTRRMFGANVGEISMLPRGRRPLRAESVALAGLGAFDRFNAGVLDVVGENLIRTLLASRIDDFAVVLMGAGSGQSLNQALGNMIVGFLRGLKDTDGERQFRGITICETNEERYMAARSELFRLSPTNLFDDFELVFREIVLPETRVVRAAAPRPESPKVYLIVRHDRDREDKEAFTASLLTSGASAAIESGRMQIQDGAGSLDKHLKQLNGIENMTKAQFETFGARLGEIVLTENVRQALKRNLDHHLVVVHDAGASRVPWETLRVQPDKPRPDSGFPAQSGGMSHRYEAANFSAAKWLRERQEGPVLEVLLVVDPTKDLAGARREAERIKAILDGFGPRANYHHLFQDEARRTELLQCFSSGKFDVVHYAGHAFFDETVRGQSGILCAGREVLSGADLAGIGNLPCLMFFNACESARVRKSDAAGKEPAKSPANIARGVSFAEALLRGGVANFVGTHWPVGDAAAAEFAAKFYEHVIGGATLNKAILEGRDAVRKLDSRDWADYVFYGDADFQVKTAGSSRGAA